MSRSSCKMLFKNVSAKLRWLARGRQTDRNWVHPQLYKGLPKMEPRHRRFRAEPYFAADPPFPSNEQRIFLVLPPLLGSMP